MTNLLNALAACATKFRGEEITVRLIDGQLYFAGTETRPYPGLELTATRHHSSRMVVVEPDNRFTRHGLSELSGRLAHVGLNDVAGQMAVAAALYGMDAMTHDFEKEEAASFMEEWG